MILEFIENLKINSSLCCHLLLCSFIFILTRWLFKVNARGLPPGPISLPILGNLLGLKKAPIDEVLMEWNRKYGGVFTFYLGVRRAIAVCGYENLKELLTKTGDNFLDRPFLHAAHKLTKGSKGVAFSNGTRWRESRKFTLMTMRDFGLGRQSLRDKVAAEACLLCQLIEKKRNTVFNMKPYLSNSVSNVICSVVYGRRFEFDDVKFTTAINAIEQIIAKSGSKNIANFIPLLRFIQTKNPVEELSAILEKFIRDNIAKHRLTFDASKPPRDFVDLYLQAESGHTEFDKSLFDEDNQYVIIRDLFIAGTETTATTLIWAVLYLSLNTDIQKRCREEIHALIGAEGLPTLEHRQSLPFVEATLREVQRISDISGLGVMRCAGSDTTFKGFRIPKGTIVFPFIHSVHYDPDRWPEPDQFRPDRWLDADGNVIHHEAFIPFSLGRRNCLGENLAKVELFIFFVILFQRFSFSIPKGHAAPRTGPMVGMARAPYPFEVLVE